MARVQSASGFDYSGGQSTTQTCVLGTVTAGNLIAVGITFGGTLTLSQLTSVTDNLGNTYTIVDRVADTGNFQCGATAYAENINGGACTITATFSVAREYRGVWAMELSGRATSGSLDANSPNYQEASGTGTDVITSGADTPTTDGCDIYVFQIASGGVTNNTTAGTGFTQYNLDSSVADTSHEFRNQATAASVAGTFSTAASGARVTGMLAFKAAVGGGDELAAQSCL